MQPEHVDALTSELTLTLKTVLAPVLADVKALQTQVAASDARWNDLSALRERVAVIEAMKALPAASDGSLDGLRDRLLVLETKAAIPPVTVPTPDADIEDLRDRVVTLETRSAGPSTADMAIVDLRERLTSLERRVVDDTLDKEKRLSVLETRAPVPGPVGPSGSDGKDGINGKDGADGLGFDDFEELYDGERTYTHRYHKGDTVKEFVHKTPMEIYRDVYAPGKTYERGDCVTWGGSEWHCNETTTSKPGDGSKAWTLKVKRGRDGKDGQDAPGALPVVSVGRR